MMRSLSKIVLHTQTSSADITFYPN